MLKPGGSHRAKLLLMSRDFMMQMFARAMERRVTLEPEKREEPQRNDRHIRCAVVERKNLGQDVEQRNRDHGARAETQQQIVESDETYVRAKGKWAYLYRTPIPPSPVETRVNEAKIIAMNRTMRGAIQS